MKLHVYVLNLMTLVRKSTRLVSAKKKKKDLQIPHNYMPTDSHTG